MHVPCALLATENDASLAVSRTGGGRALDEDRNSAVLVLSFRFAHRESALASADVGIRAEVEPAGLEAKESEKSAVAADYGQAAAARAIRFLERLGRSRVGLDRPSVESCDRSRGRAVVDVWGLDDMLVDANGPLAPAANGVRSPQTSAVRSVTDMIGSELPPPNCE